MPALQLDLPTMGLETEAIFDECTKIATQVVPCCCYIGLHLCVSGERIPTSGSNIAQSGYIECRTGTASSPIVYVEHLPVARLLNDLVEQRTK